MNLDEGVLVVRSVLEELSGGLKVKGLKTSAGRRVVAPDDEAIKALRSRLKKAKEEGFESADVPIVFANERGGYLPGLKLRSTCLVSNQKSGRHSR